MKVSLNGLYDPKTYAGLENVVIALCRALRSGSYQQLLDKRQALAVSLLEAKLNNSDLNTAIFNVIPSAQELCIDFEEIKDIDNTASLIDVTGYEAKYGNVNTALFSNRNSSGTADLLLGVLREQMQREQQERAASMVKFESLTISSPLSSRASSPDSPGPRFPSLRKISSFRGFSPIIRRDSEKSENENSTRATSPLQLQRAPTPMSPLSTGGNNNRRGSSSPTKSKIGSPS